MADVVSSEQQQQYSAQELVRQALAIFPDQSRGMQLLNEFVAAANSNATFSGLDDLLVKASEAYPELIYLYVAAQPTNMSHPLQSKYRNRLWLNNEYRYQGHQKSQQAILAAFGLTMKDQVPLSGIARSPVEKWLKNHPELTLHQTLTDSNGDTVAIANMLAMRFLRCFDHVYQYMLQEKIPEEQGYWEDTAEEVAPSFLPISRALKLLAYSARYPDSRISQVVDLLAAHAHQFMFPVGEQSDCEIQQAIIGLAKQGSSHPPVVNENLWRSLASKTQHENAVPQESNQSCLQQMQAIIKKYLNNEEAQTALGKQLARYCDKHSSKEEIIHHFERIILGAYGFPYGAAFLNDHVVVKPEHPTESPVFLPAVEMILRVFSGKSKEELKYDNRYCAHKYSAQYVIPNVVYLIHAYCGYNVVTVDHNEVRKFTGVASDTAEEFHYRLEKKEDTSGTGAGYRLKDVFDQFKAQKITDGNLQFTAEELHQRVIDEFATPIWNDFLFLYQALVKTETGFSSKCGDYFDAGNKNAASLLAYACERAWRHPNSRTARVLDMLVNKIKNNQNYFTQTQQSERLGDQETLKQNLAEHAVMMSPVSSCLYMTLWGTSGMKKRAETALNAVKPVVSQ
jgi:hypothetical protein